MDVLIRNCTVVTCDNEGTIIQDGAIAVSGETITAIGKTDDLERRFNHLETIDGQGKAVLPGFINAHTHTVLNVLRGTVEDLDAGAVYTYMTPITFAMTPDERSAIASLGCLEAIKCGTTTLVDPLRHVHTYAQAMVDSGLRLFLSESCADALTLQIRFGNYEYSRQWGEEFLERAVTLVEKFHNVENGRVQCQIAAHATDNCSPWMLGELLALSEKYDLRRTIHLAQSRDEVAQIKALNGGTPVEYLRDNGWLGSELLAAHWIFCTEQDIEILAETGTHMAHCPASGSRHGSHSGAKMPTIFDAGVNVALGTDNMSEDMFQALSIGLIINRGKRGSGTEPAPSQILDCATRNGAFALDRQANLGTIEQGKLADLSIVNLRRPHLTPNINLLSNLVHYGQASDVESVMVGGRMVMQNGKVLTMNEDDTLRNAQEATANAWARMHEMYPDIRVPEISKQN